MLLEAINRIAQLGSKEKSVEIHEFCNRKKIVRQGDDFQILEVDPPPRNHSVSDLASFVDATTDLKAEACMVFVGEEFVIAVLDDGTRSDRVIWKLERSQAFLQLMELATPCKQPAVVAALREELADTYDPKLLAIVRRLDFKRRNDGHSHIEHGRESLGRSVESVVQSSEGDLPEVTLFQLRCFKDPSFDSSISLKCAITPDAMTETLAFRPTGEQLGDELLRVRRRLVTELQEDLAGSGSKEQRVTVVLGTP